MLVTSQPPHGHIYLADDDCDDRDLFAQALSAVNDEIVLTQLLDGIHLMDTLNLPPFPLPGIVFVDLNMPKKSGMDCLEEIKSNANGLQHINVVMLTMSSNPKSVDEAFSKGASFYAIKPNSFGSLKLLISKMVLHDWLLPVDRNDFLIQL
ncbi:response regulator [Flavobacterium sp.]|uniref:response regulator n=1 Tax=Flavobacterium sp. TaxID=239 RepID=UPI0039E2AB57